MRTRFGLSLRISPSSKPSPIEGERTPVLHRWAGWTGLGRGRDCHATVAMTVGQSGLTKWVGVRANSVQSTPDPFDHPPTKKPLIHQGLTGVCIWCFPLRVGRRAGMWFRKQLYHCQPVRLAPKRRRKAISLPSPPYLHIPRPLSRREKGQSVPLVFARYGAQRPGCYCPQANGTAVMPTGNHLTTPWYSPSVCVESASIISRPRRLGVELRKKKSNQ